MKILTEEDLLQIVQDKGLPAISSLRLAHMAQCRHSDIHNTARRILAQERISLANHTYSFFTEDEMTSTALIIPNSIAKMITLRLSCSEIIKERVTVELDGRNDDFLFALSKQELMSLVKRFL